MDTNPEKGRQPRNPLEDGGETVVDSSSVIQEAGDETVSESGLPKLDVLLGLEELYPGFIELVLVQIPEIKLETISSHLSAAIQEVATELGKDRLAELAATKAVSESGLPNLKALIELEKLHPRFIELVFVRMQEIQQQTYQTELDTPQEQVTRTFGKTITGFFRKKH